LTAEQLSEVSAAVRGSAGKYGQAIFVQGSRAAGTAGATSDLDIAIRVSSEEFDAIIAKRFGTPNVGSAKWKTMQRAIESGKIQRGEIGLSGVGEELQGSLGMKVDISVIRIGGQFDNGSLIPLQ
jgi:hypothetical protein